MTMERASEGRRGGRESEDGKAGKERWREGGREGGGRLVATRGRSGYTHGVRTGTGRSGVAWEEAADGWSQDPGG
jgi:hypothetical protein